MIGRACSETIEDKLNYNFLTYHRSIKQHGEYTYLNLLSKILEQGEERDTRSGKTLSIFGARMEFQITSSIPLLTTKQMAWKTCIKELLWFLRGETDNKSLQKDGVHIWDGNTSREFLD